MKPLTLGEIPFSQLFADNRHEPLRLYLEKAVLKQVEVIPSERKWILHLSSTSPIDQQILDRIAEVIKVNVPEVSQIVINLETQGSYGSFLELCASFWEQIVNDLRELLPAVRGWLTPETRYDIESHDMLDELTVYVPNELGVEYFRTKNKVIENYFGHRYGFNVHVGCKVDAEISSYNSVDFVAEEQERVEEILANQMRKEAVEEKKNSRLVLGKEFNADPILINEVQDEEKQVVVLGSVFNIETRKLKTGRTLFTFNLTDKKDSIGCKVFLEEGKDSLDLKDKEWVKVRGAVQFDRFSSELTLMARDIVRETALLRMDNALEKRVELHLHTRMSTMDGISSIQSMIERAGLWGHEAIAVTDHGVVQAFPEAVDAGKKYGVKIIMGVEGYLVDDSPGPQPLNQRKNRHVILLVKNKKGLKNLYKLISLSHLEYYHRRPRIPKSQITKLREGLLVGSACEAGELIQAILQKETQENLVEIAKFYDYLEIQPIGNNSFLIRNGQAHNEDDLREINRAVWKLGKQLGKPVVATGDVHFLDPEDEVYRRILMAGKGFEDADNQAPLYLRTTEEMLEEFEYLGEAEALEAVIYAPRSLAAQIEALKPFPDDLFAPTISGAEEKIETMCWEKARELYGEPLPEVVKERLDKELKSIIGHGFSVLYLISHLLVKKSNEDGYLVGSRGSVGSSLVATFTGITEVNPLPPHYRCQNSACLYSIWIRDGSIGSGVDLQDKDCPQCGNKLVKDGHDIPFETFLGFKGDKVPDIDLNFSGDYQPRAHKYTEELFGKEYVFRAGTIATIAEKTAFGFVKNYVDERNLRLRTSEMSRLVGGCTGVKRTTGQHPGGLMVVPKECDVFDFTPLQRPADDPNSETITTHFDYHSISGRLVKLDILGHDDPTVIKMLEDLTGVDAKSITLDDPLTLSLFASPEALGVKEEDINSKTGTFGIPEFGTKFVRQMLEDTQPKTFSDLVRISGLSHGTDVWLGNAQELVRNGTATISEIIACRDDIMIYLIYKGLDPGWAFKIMENVRKGKGLKPEDIEEMRQNNVPEWYINSCLKIRYMFPKAHAVAYVTMAFRIAWFKVNYPEAFYATFFTVRADEFDAELISQGLEACRARIKDIESKGNEASTKERNLVTILELAVEMYCRGINMLRVDLWKSDSTRFLITPTGILPPFASLQGLGDAAAKSIVSFRDEVGIKSIEDLKSGARLSKTVIEILGKHGCLEGLPEENQLSLF